jgi:hypothetical protein
LQAGYLTWRNRPASTTEISKQQRLGGTGIAPVRESLGRLSAAKNAAATLRMRRFVFIVG